MDYNIYASNEIDNGKYILKRSIPSKNFNTLYDYGFLGGMNIDTGTICMVESHSTITKYIRWVMKNSISNRPEIGIISVPPLFQHPASWRNLEETTLFPPKEAASIHIFYESSRLTDDISRYPMNYNHLENVQARSEGLHNCSAFLNDSLDTHTWFAKEGTISFFILKDNRHRCRPNDELERSSQLSVQRDEFLAKGIIGQSRVGSSSPCNR